MCVGLYIYIYILSGVYGPQLPFSGLQSDVETSVKGHPSLDLEEQRSGSRGLFFFFFIGVFIGRRRAEKAALRGSAG